MNHILKFLFATALCLTACSGSPETSSSGRSAPGDAAASYGNLQAESRSADGDMLYATLRDQELHTLATLTWSNTAHSGSWTVSDATGELGSQLPGPMTLEEANDTVHAMWVRLTATQPPASPQELSPGQGTLHPDMVTVCLCVLHIAACCNDNNQCWVRLC